MGSRTGCRRAAGGALPQSDEHIGGIGFEAGAETLGRELFGNRDRTGRGVERIERRLGGIGLELALSQTGKRRLAFGERAFENWGTLDAAAASDPDGLCRTCDAPS